MSSTGSFNPIFQLELCRIALMQATKQKQGSVDAEKDSLCFLEISARHGRRAILSAGSPGAAPKKCPTSRSAALRRRSPSQMRCGVEDVLRDSQTDSARIGGLKWWRRIGEDAGPRMRSSNSRLRVAGARPDLGDSAAIWYFSIVAAAMAALIFGPSRRMPSNKSAW